MTVGGSQRDKTQERNRKVTVLPPAHSPKPLAYFRRPRWSHTGPEASPLPRRVDPRSSY